MNLEQTSNVFLIAGLMILFQLGLCRKCALWKRLFESFLRRAGLLGVRYRAKGLIFRPRALGGSMTVSAILLGTGVSIVPGAGRLNPVPRLTYGDTTVPIRIPAKKVTWAATNVLPEKAVVLKRVKYAEPFIDVRKLLRALDVPDAEKFNAWYGDSKWNDDAGGYGVHYQLADGKFEYSFQSNRKREWTMSDPPLVAEIRRRLLAMLTSVGFPTSELRIDFPDSSLAGTTEGTTSGWNPDTKERFKRVAERGVSVGRRYRGVTVRSFDSEVRFEFHGDCISVLTIDWPAFAPLTEGRVASPAQIVRWLSEGRGAIQNVETTGNRSIELKNVQSFRIIGTTLVYWRDWGEFENPGPSFPMIMLDTEMTLGPGDVVDDAILAPAISFGLPVAQKNYEDSIGLFP